ncbi:plasmid replication protein RepC [Salipiger aestuarii]|uniref:plasmid replication protein RepC n=1 Tax=Salipiger aestuarii TaxID=568098 RepID=UPI0016813441|nr:plasmid replication protein RepC [Salipiger aestuarii]KAA8609410.1 replication initiation protein [Salipiger aestuarii]
MGYSPITPFGRPVKAAPLPPSRMSPPDCSPVDKWQLLRELGQARRRYGLSDRDLSVLQALLSFHPETKLGGSAPLVVHPSNAAICERAHGMPCSTMRRHLARLVDAGLLVRRDSPNGKRYARRIAGSKIAFGFDLTPLLVRAAEIGMAAADVRAAAARIAALRETVSLMRRDLAGLAVFGKDRDPDNAVWDQMSDTATLAARDLRRKLDEPALEALETMLKRALTTAATMLSTDFDPAATDDPVTTDSQNEQHHQSSQKDNIESRNIRVTTAPLPFALVAQTCTEIAVYAGEPIAGWHGLVTAAEKVRPMTGISASAWEDAKSVMGAIEASVVVSAILERFSEIRSPGGYLRHLTRKAQERAFSVLPMVLALSNRPARRGSQL